VGTNKRLTPAQAAVAAGGRAPRKVPARDPRADDGDIVEVWGRDSFPASDPPANW
jgi:hypothetical protein